MNIFRNPEFLPDGYKIYSPLNHPFKICGLQHNGEFYYRLSDEIAKQCNDGVLHHCRHTAGGRIRFTTDADEFSLHANTQRPDRMSHFAFTGSCGMDVYCNNIYISTVKPDFDNPDYLESKISLPGNGKKLITVNFPTYCGITELYFAFPENAVIEESTPYKITKPVVFYGSSITQGGCSSRPGNTYEQILSRELDFDYINLGFSGSAKGEKAITEYIANLDMSVFVYDYDHNAPTAEYLKNTHSKMFNAIRKVQPDLPVIMLTRPKFHLTDEEKDRVKIVESTFNEALNRGDKNVYFIPGNTLIKPEFAEISTVDNTHPNDAGFYSMASTIKPVLEALL